MIADPREIAITITDGARLPPDGAAMAIPISRGGEGLDRASDGRYWHCIFIAQICSKGGRHVGSHNDYGGARSARVLPRSVLG